MQSAVRSLLAEVAVIAVKMQVLFKVKMQGAVVFLHVFLPVSVWFSTLLLFFSVSCNTAKIGRINCPAASSLPFLGGSLYAFPKHGSDLLSALDRHERLRAGFIAVDVFLEGEIAFVGLGVWSELLFLVSVKIARGN